MNERRGTPLTAGPSAATDLTGERKTVTALFVDIVGSTALAESMDPEEWAEIVTGALHDLSRPVQRYEGTVAQYLGDGMLVYFGTPVAHEDDAERAVRAALEMIEATRRYGESLVARRRPELHVRIGINTGPVVVTELAGDPGAGRTAIGDTVNVAARMQATADPDTIRITESTERLVSHAIEVRDLGSVEVKGKAEPVHSFAIVGTRAVRARTRGLPGMTSPLVGRRREAEALRTALSGITADAGAAAVILGEPGIGKSRLLREVRASVEAADLAQWQEVQVVSHGRTLPFHLLAALVALLARLPDDDPDARRRVLEAALPPSSGDTAPGTHDPATGSAADHLAHLLSLPMADGVRQALERAEPDRLRRFYADGIATLVRRATGSTPLILVVEDAHWADESSIDTLVRALPAFAATRALFIVTSRPDPGSVAAPMFDALRTAFGERTIELALAPLSEEDSRALVSHLLEIESLPDAVRATILSRAEGNPLFVEEVIRMLVERGVVVRRHDRWVARQGIDAVEVPPTLHGLLLARIDALPGPARHALRAASVIGRTFSTQTLDEIAGPLDGSIDTLQAVGLIEASDAEQGNGADRFTFRHALIQETAYESLLRRDRAELHRAVASALERSAPDRLDELAAELAMHLDLAGDHAAAAEWAFRGARHAELQGAMPEARELYDRAAGWLPDEPGNARRRVEIALGQGRSGLYFKAFDAELQRLDQAAVWAEDVGDERLLVEVYAAIAFALSIRGDQYETSADLRRAVDRAVDIGERLGDDPIRGRPLLARGGARLMAGDYDAAVEDLAAAVPLLEAAGDLLWAFEAQNNLAWAYGRLGLRDEADAAVRGAVELAERSGSPTARVDVKSTVAINHQEREEFDAALRIAREAAAEGEEKRILTCAAFGHLTAGEILLQRGETSEAERSLDRATRLARVTQAAFIENLGRAGLNAARWASGRHDEALEGWAKGLDRAGSSGDPFAAADIRWRRGAALAGDGVTLDAGIADLEAAAQGFGALHARPAQARTLRDLQDAYERAGRSEDAVRTAIEVDRLRREIGLEPVAAD